MAVCRCARARACVWCVCKDFRTHDGAKPAGHLEVLKELAEFGAQAEEEEEAPAAAAEEAPATITRTGSSCDLELKNQAGYTALMWAVVRTAGSMRT